MANLRGRQGNGLDGLRAVAGAKGSDSAASAVEVEDVDASSPKSTRDLAVVAAQSELDCDSEGEETPTAAVEAAPPPRRARQDAKKVGGSNRGQNGSRRVLHPG